MGCCSSTQKAASPAPHMGQKTISAQHSSAKKDSVDGKPRPDDIVIISGQAAKVCEATALDVNIQYPGSGTETWVEVQEIMVTKSKVTLDEVKPGVEVTTIEGAKGKVSRRTNTEIYLQTNDGKEKVVGIEDITVVKLFIERATNLANNELLSNSDPYVTCQLVGKPQSLIKTPMVANDPNPEWNFEVGLMGYTTGDALIFEVVRDQDMIRDDYLGKCILEHDRFHATEFVGELPLLNKKGEPGQGSLHIRAKIEAAAPLLLEEVPEAQQDGPMILTTLEAAAESKHGELWGFCC